MIKYLSSAIALALLALTAGCATVVRGTNETVTIKTPDCPGARCVLQHKKGRWEVESPGSVVIPRSDDPLKIDCSKGSESVSIQVDSGVSSGAVAGDVVEGEIKQLEGTGRVVF